MSQYKQRIHDLYDYLSANFEKVTQRFLVLYLVMAPTIVIIAKGETKTAGILIVAGATALLFTRLPDILSIKLFGLQATMERQISKVQVTIEALQKMATAMATGNLTQLVMTGQHFHGLHTEAKFYIRDRIIESLKEIGVSDDETLKAQDAWIQVNSNLLLSVITKEAVNHLPSADIKIDKLPQQPRYGSPEPQILEQWVASHSLNSPMMSRLLEEYRNLLTTGSMKDPAIIPFNLAMKERPGA
jgi:hypothetical protein